MENKKEESCLPYGSLVTKVLEDTWYNFIDEEFKGETTIIGFFFTINGGWNHKWKDNWKAPIKWEEKKTQKSRSTNRIRQPR